MIIPSVRQLAPFPRPHTDPLSRAIHSVRRALPNSQKECPLEMADTFEDLQGRLCEQIKTQVNKLYSNIPKKKQTRGETYFLSSDSDTVWNEFVDNAVHATGPWGLRGKLLETCCIGEFEEEYYRDGNYNLPRRSEKRMLAALKSLVEAFEKGGIWCVWSLD